MDEHAAQRPAGRPGDDHVPQHLGRRRGLRRLAADHCLPELERRKLKHPIGAYSLRVVIALSDAGGGPFSYLLQVVDPRKPSNALVYKPGQTTTGAVSSTSRIRPAKRTRVLQLKITASDAVGNEPAFTKALRLR